LPDGSVNSYNNASKVELNYTVNKNGNYEFIIYDVDNRKTIKKVVVNILEEEIILKDYIVELSLENAITDINTKKVKEGESVTFEVSPLENYIFKSLECVDGATFEDNILTIDNVNEDINCKISYKGIDLVIKYDVNTGSNIMEDSLYSYGDEIILQKNTFEKEGYQFLGWSLDKNSHNPTYLDEGKVENLTEKETTLYAIWKKTVTAIFKLNTARSIGATKASCDIYNGDTSCQIKAPTITSYDGDTVIGWDTSSSAVNSEFKENDSINLFEDTTYYAITGSTSIAIKEISYQKLLELFNSDTTSIIYIGRPSCSACTSFYPNLRKAAEKNNLDINYLNTDNLTSEDKENLRLLIEDFTTTIVTPYTFTVQSGNIIDKLVGSYEVSTIEKLFRNSGLI